MTWIFRGFLTTPFYSTCRKKNVGGFRMLMISLKAVSSYPARSLRFALRLHQVHLFYVAPHHFDHYICMHPSITSRVRILQRLPPQKVHPFDQFFPLQRAPFRTRIANAYIYIPNRQCFIFSIGKNKTGVVIYGLH